MQIINILQRPIIKLTIMKIINPLNHFSIHKDNEQLLRAMIINANHEIHNNQLQSMKIFEINAFV